MFADGGIGPMTGSATTGLWPGQADEHRSPRRVANIADHPVATLAMAGGEIMAAYGFGLPAETARKIRRVILP